jgi:hypothetical protein
MHPVQARVRRHGGQEAREHRGRDPVVGIEEQHPVVPGVREPVVAGRARPRCGCRRTRTRGSRAAKYSATRAVPSSEPSSITTASQLGSVWATSDARASGSVSAALCAGMMMETGMGISLPAAWRGWRRAALALERQVADGQDLVD